MAVWRRNQWAIAGGLGSLLFGLLTLRSTSELLTAALLVAAFLSATVPTVIEVELHRRDELAKELAELEAAAQAIAAEEEDERAACRTVAAAAREIMLETSLWIDPDEQIAWLDGMMSPGKIIPVPRDWSVDAIVARGAAGLRGRVSWYNLATALGTYAEQLSSYAGTYSGRMSHDALVALEAVMLAAEKAAEGARDGSSADAAAVEMPAAFYPAGQPPAISPEDRRVRQDAVEDARTGFVLALQNLQGSVELLERHCEPLPSDAQGDDHLGS